MKRWYVAPKKFSGALGLAGQSVPVRFSVEISKKGAPKVRLDEMPYDASTMFISDAFYDQQGEMRFAEFTLAGQARDGSTFRSDSVLITALESRHSDSAPPIMTPKLWCPECKIVSPADPGATTGVRALLRASVA